MAAEDPADGQVGDEVVLGLARPDGRDLKGQQVDGGAVDSAPDLLVTDLARRFAHLPRRVVVDEVGAAARELRGQVPAAAMDELLHRLAAYRLGRRMITR